MPLHGIDHLELWVGNAAQAAYVFTHAYGFTEVAYAGLETGLRDCTSHVLQQGRIRLVLTGALGATGELAEHHRAHGDGVKVIALGVPDVAAAYREAHRPRRARPARALRPLRRARHRPASPRSRPTATPSTASSSAAATTARSCPATSRSRTPATRAQPGLLAGIDHVVANVELGAMDGG